ncbi:growth-regulating factor 4-like isoform X2 [Zingiber officinale]|uniref:growth-regulating factor 4-like isoform X2 n=1 Tax=Zingiber officinale TaxID=94328 RepID=UPI001C4B938E|nr:growth-regulating factor 4-like isoform X2 [Zingiber officinale]
MNSTSGEATKGVGRRPPFTEVQWQELEHQAMIYKYFMAGLPVPPELIVPVQRSFEVLPGRYYHRPALSYCSYYGRKLDPEPGRCRRTDGKKWRCSKDAHPDSKYCIHHMHRGRNRSRKPVESQSISQLQLSSSTGTTTSPTAGSSIPQHSITERSNTSSLFLGSSSSLQLHMDPGPLESRYLSSTKPGMAEHTFLTETSGSARGQGIYGIDNLWHLTSPRVSSWPSTKFSTPYSVQTTYPQFPVVQHLSQATLSPVSRQQHSFIRSEDDAPATTKHEGQFVLPFFNEWLKTRESWCNLEEDRSKLASISTTQLSMTFPIAASDISTSSSKSSKSESASSHTEPT